MHCDLVQRPWDIGVGVPLPDVIGVDFFLLLLWHMWKARNAMIFDQIDSAPRKVFNRVAVDLDAYGRDDTRNIDKFYRFGEPGSQRVTPSSLLS